jgi:hypothetical protein
MNETNVILKYFEKMETDKTSFSNIITLPKFETKRYNTSPSTRLIVKFQININD